MPILSLDEHELSITELTNRAAPSRFAQSSGKTPSSASKDRLKPRKDPITVPDPSDDDPLSDQANEPQAKAHKWDPTPELVVVDDDDSTPSPEGRRLPRSRYQWRRKLLRHSYSASRVRPELCSTTWS